MERGLKNLKTALEMLCQPPLMYETLLIKLSYTSVSQTMCICIYMCMWHISTEQIATRIIFKHFLYANMRMHNAVDMHAGYHTHIPNYSPAHTTKRSVYQNACKDKIFKV